MIPGETILSGAPNPCPRCNVEMDWEVCSSAAGYFIGTVYRCGPVYSRETVYMSESKANAVLLAWKAGVFLFRRV